MTELGRVTFSPDHVRFLVDCRLRSCSIYIEYKIIKNREDKAERWQMLVCCNPIGQSKLDSTTNPSGEMLLQPDRAERAL